MSSIKRRLAAIMFTDLVGYTAMMQHDELRARKIRNRHRDVLEDSVKNYNGEILQYYGDGTLCIFNSGVEAVQSAIDIQKKLNEDPKIPLRIGIHTGDVVLEEDGIYGDGVNIASRIESISVSGAVLISGKLQDEIANQPQIETKHLGTFELKNVRRPVEIYAVSSEGIKVPSSAELRLEKAKAAKSIAVIPFINMSADPENEYFSDGITEEILNALVKVDGLQVTSRTSSFAFKGKKLDVKEIAKQLNVSTILEGSVRKSGNRVRITAQLINASDDFHIWSETYDRNLEDIFKVQDELATRIATSLREKLSGQEHKENLVTATTQNIQAYNLYLKGVFNFNKWTPDGAKKGITCFSEALKLEPNFAAAHSQLAFGYMMLGILGHLHSKKAYPLAKQYSNSALKLDDKLPEAHVSLALIQIFIDWNLEESYNSFQRAFELSPGDAKVMHAYSFYLTASEKFDEAVDVMKRAVELDPLSLPINEALGEAFYHAKKYDEAIAQYDKTLELDPNFRNAIEAKGWAYLAKNDFENAIGSFEKYHQKVGDPLKGLTGLAHAYAVAGEKEKALDLLNKMKEREAIEEDISMNMDYIIVYTGLKDFDNAFKYLDKALEDGNVAFYIRTHEAAKELREDPRFDELMKKIKPVTS